MGARSGRGRPTAPASHASQARVRRVHRMPRVHYMHCVHRMHCVHCVHRVHRMHRTPGSLVNGGRGREPGGRAQPRKVQRRPRGRASSGGAVVGTPGAVVGTPGAVEGTLPRGQVLHGPFMGDKATTLTYHGVASTGVRNDGRSPKNRGLQQPRFGRFSAVACPKPTPKSAQIDAI